MHIYLTRLLLETIISHMHGLKKQAGTLCIDIAVNNDIRSLDVVHNVMEVSSLNKIRRWGKRL